jgi:CubicO group peptidase (beta-lactamase class C family)
VFSGVHSKENKNIFLIRIKTHILPLTSLIQVLHTQLDFKFNGQDDFSLGFGITSEKSANLNFRNKGSFSWGGYYGTSYWADPKDKMVVLIMTQHNPNSHGELGGIIERIIYGSRVN